MRYLRFLNFANCFLFTIFFSELSFADWGDAFGSLLRDLSFSSFAGLLSAILFFFSRMKRNALNGAYAFFVFVSTTFLATTALQNGFELRRFIEVFEESDYPSRSRYIGFLISSMLAFGGPFITAIFLSKKRFLISFLTFLLLIFAYIYPRYLL